jgi:hypothetical protein
MNAPRNYLAIAAACLAASWVAFGLLTANREEQLVWKRGDYGYAHYRYSYGWPWSFHECTFGFRLANSRGPFDVEWRSASAILNGLAAVVLIGATAACGLQWQSQKSHRITLSGLFVLLTIVAVLIALYQRALFLRLPSYQIAPLMAGVAAVTYWFCGSVTIAFRSRESTRL